MTFAVTGLGNGLFIVSNRVLLQRRVPERFYARAFGLLTTGESWGFAGAAPAGGALLAVFALSVVSRRTRDLQAPGGVAVGYKW